MKELEQEIKDAMIEHGAIGDKWRINIDEIAGDKNSDYRRVEVVCYKPRCKKPYMVWNLAIDIVRELLFWETSTFYYL